MSVATATTDTSSESKLYTGIVKWYSKKLGYGYIEALTVDGSPCDPIDSFVHYTAITVDDTCTDNTAEVFRYLVQGEAVEYTVVPVVGHEKHTHQADKVTGICGRNLTYQQRLVRGDVLRQRGEEKKKYGGRKGKTNEVTGYKYARDDEYVKVKRGRHAKDSSSSHGGATVIIVNRRDEGGYFSGKGRGAGRGRGGRGRGRDMRTVM